jgi:iron complex transport system substrate-binding protein
MDFDSDDDSGRTRRRVLAAGTTVLGGTALAGCASNDDATSVDDETTVDATSRATTDEDTDADAETATGSYQACIEPAGCLTFEAPPDSYVVYNGAWADMAFALGQRDGFLTAGNMIPDFFFDPFDVDVPSPESLPTLANWDGGGWSKEVFYELDPDVILMDPNYMHGTGWDGDWDEADTDEIARKVAPFFGNNCRRRREFHDYKLYSLYGAFEKAAALFQERERYEAIEAVHADLQETVQSRLPPEDDRPTVGLINGGSNPENGSFYPLHTRGEGYEMKPWRDLDVASAFPASMAGGAIDYEQLLEVDPEILVVHWGIGVTGPETEGFARDRFREQYVEPMADDPVGSQLTAVENGDVYPGPYGEQGPLVNLLQTEMLAQQLYPDEFGAFDADAFPSVPASKQLFDRQRVRDVVAGDR